MNDFKTAKLQAYLSQSYFLTEGFFIRSRYFLALWHYRQPLTLLN